MVPVTIPVEPQNPMLTVRISVRVTPVTAIMLMAIDPYIDGRQVMCHHLGHHCHQHCLDAVLPSLVIPVFPVPVVC